METSGGTLEVARELIRVGVSVVPIAANGLKEPIGKWKSYQSRLASETELLGWFGNGQPMGLAALGGQVSGFLEILDIDDRALVRLFRDLVEQEAPGLMARLLVVKSPRPGFHLWYRCPEGIERNQKLARRQTGTKPDGTPEVQTLIETRGEGGYVLCPGSAPEAHETGRRYELAQGSFGEIPIISAEERALLFRCARALNEYTERERHVGVKAPSKERSDSRRPGDLYNERGDLLQLLRSHGWTVTQSDGDSQLLRRPGKARGHSATLGKVAPGIFYVYSTNAAPFESETSYDAFGCYALLVHGGDFSAAARDLAAQGYKEATSGPEKQKTDNAASSDPSGAEEETKGSGRDRDDLKLASAFVEDRKGQLLYVRGDQWWMYDPSGAWSYAGRECAEKLLQDWLIERMEIDPKLVVTRSKINNVLYIAKSMLGPKPMSDFDSRTDWIPLANGVLDLNTNLLMDHSPDNRVTQLLPYNYGPTAEAPRWQRFLREVLIDRDGKPCPSWIGLIQEWFGYCLIPSTAAQVSMFWVGGGANGKGVMERVLSALVGEDQVAGIDLEHLHDPYHRAELHGKLVGLLNEIERRAMNKNGQLFKAIVGGDKISARRPTERVFDFRPYVRIVVTCNALPNTDDLSHGYFRRIILVEFRRQFDDEERDQNLDTLLRAELPGILNWALQGLKRLRERGFRFEIPEESTALVQEYRRSEDSFESFFSERCDLDIAAATPAAQLYSAYQLWCAGNGHRPISGTGFGRRLAKAGGRQTLETIGFRRTRCWAGIKLLVDQAGEQV